MAPVSAIAADGPTAAVAGAPAYKPLIAAPPSWVESMAIPPPKTAANGGVQLLLTDFQSRFSQESSLFYEAHAIRILDASGMAKLGSLAFAWNPETQSLTIHHIRILRGATVIDLLAKPDAITVLRREKNLEMATLDGALTAVIQPEGLQPGDVLDYALTIDNHDPILKGVFEGVFEAPQGLVAQRYRLRLLWDRGTPLRWRLPSAFGEPIVGSTGPMSSLVVERDDLESPPAPAGAPPRFQHPGRGTVTASAAWSQIADLMRPLYEQAATLAPDSPLRAEIARIAKDTPDPKVRAAAALHLAGQQVRYLLLAMNLGGYKPAAADVTWARRFGDCKGKTALLLSLLRGLGIDAVPALVSTTDGDGLDNALPRVGAFDHVIVRVRVSGRIYWLDATRMGDRGLDDLKPPGFRWALPLTPGAGLEAIEQPPASDPLIFEALRIDLSRGPDAPAALKLTIRLQGDGAILAHLGFDSMSPADRERSLQNALTNNYAWAKPGPVRADWDEASGTETVELNGVGQVPWIPFDGGRQLFVPESGLGGEESYQRATGADATAPYSVDYPAAASHSVTIVLPNKGQGYQLAGGADIDRTIGGVVFHRRSNLANGIVTVETNTHSIQREFPASEAQGVADALREIGQKDVWIDGPPKSAAMIAPEPAAPKGHPVIINGAAGLPEPKTAEEFGRRGLAWLRERDYDRAIADLREAAKLDPKVARTFINLGIAHANKRDYASARADFEMALTLEPGSASALSGRGRARVFLGDLAGGRADLEAGIAGEPESPAGLWTAALTMAEANRTSEALGYFDRLIARFPTDSQLAEWLNARCWARATANIELTRAKADCESALKLRPGDSQYLDSQALLELRLGRLDDARRDYDAAAAISPVSAMTYYGRGLVRTRQGDVPGARADFAAAAKADPTAQVRFASWGLKP